MSAYQSNCCSFGVESTTHTKPTTSECCFLKSTDSNAAQKAFAAFVALTSECGAANKVVNAANLGPFGDNGSCDYDCGFKEQTWWWKANYTQIVKTNQLEPGVNSMDLSGSYQQAFNQTEQWLNASLPTYTKSFTEDVGNIEKTDAEIIAAGGDETPAQKAALETAFKNASQMIANSNNQTNAALKALAQFISNNTSMKDYLSNLSTSTHDYIKTDATNTENNLIGQIACGSGDVRSSFNGMFSTIDTAYNTMTTAFNSVESDLVVALNAASSVTGAFLNVQSDNTVIAQNLSKSNQYAPTDPLRKFYLQLAQESWTSYVTYAQSQLAT